MSSRRGMSGIITLSFFSAEIEVQKDFDFFRSRLHFVRCSGLEARGPSGPLVSDLQEPWSPLIKGQLRRLTPQDGSKSSSRLDDS